MIQQFRVNFPLLKSKFFEHENIKKSLIKKINLSQDNDKNYMEDRIEKFDWFLSKDFSREWVKEIFNPLNIQLNVFAQKIGFNKLTINNLWFQRYKKNSIHNWHVHGDNYTGVYYLELPKDNVSCLTEFLYPDNLEKSFSIDANEGDIIFFPSFLIHRAPSLQSKKTKTIISWNCNFNEIQSKYTYDRKNTKLYNEKKQIVQLKGD